MSFSPPIPPTKQTSGQAHEAFEHGWRADASARDRFLIVEGGTGSGKTHSLATIASIGRTRAETVIELRAHDGDPVITAASMAAFIGHLPRLGVIAGLAQTPRRGTPRGDEGRLVVLVDDWDLLDLSARTQLHALLTRSVHDSSAICAIATKDRTSVPGWADAAHVVLQPLAPREAEALLRTRGIRLTPRLRGVLLALADGNAGLLETLGRAWTERTGPDTYFPPYPQLNGSLAASTASCDALSDAARDVVLRAAIASVELPFPTPIAALGDQAAIHEAIGQGVLSGRRTAATFVDPYVRVAVLCAADDDRLRQARLDLAGHHGSSEHLLAFIDAARADRPKAELARRVGTVAGACLRAGRARDALIALAEAERLSESSATRTRFAARRALVAAFLGDAAGAEDWLAPQRHRSTPGAVLAEFVAVEQFSRVVQNGGLRDAKQVLIAELHARSDERGDGVDALITVLLLICLLRGDGACWAEAAAVIADHPAEPLHRLVEECRHRSPGDAFAELAVEAGRSAATGDPWKQLSLQVAWSLLDHTDPRRHVVGSLFLQPDTDDDLLSMFTAYRVALTAFHAGRLAEADERFTLLRQRTVELGAHALTAAVDSAHSLVHALRGDAERMLRTTEAASQWALDNGAPFLARVADHARSSFDLATSHFEAAHARVAARPSRPLGRPGSPYGTLELVDAVEASSRLRVFASELAHTDGPASDSTITGSPRHRMLLQLARAIAGGSVDPRADFEAALAALPEDEVPFEAARAHLAFGEWLRRQHSPLEARVQFRLAESAFALIGAEAWRGRATSELRAAGGAPPPSDTTATRSAAVILSAQERRVVALAAAGLSNKQIASRLFLSPRTVSGHLYRMFPKLGVTSRAGLRDALIGLDIDESESA